MILKKSKVFIVLLKKSVIFLLLEVENDCYA